MNKPAMRTPGEQQPDETDLDELQPVTLKAKKLTLEERFDLLEAENARLRANQSPSKAAAVDPTEHLPDISEYTGENQNKQNSLSSAVLTKQGWVAPAHLGANPAALNELAKRGFATTSAG